jgi:hypothetical protein
MMHCVAARIGGFHEVAPGVIPIEPAAIGRRFNFYLAPGLIVTIGTLAAVRPLFEDYAVLAVIDELDRIA